MCNVFLSVRGLSEYLNISVSLVRKLVKKGELPHNRLEDIVISLNALSMYTM